MGLTTPSMQPGSCAGPAAMLRHAPAFLPSGPIAPVDHKMSHGSHCTWYETPTRDATGFSGRNALTARGQPLSWHTKAVFGEAGQPQNHAMYHSNAVCKGDTGFARTARRQSSPWYAISADFPGDAPSSTAARPPVCQRPCPLRRTLHQATTQAPTRPPRPWVCWPRRTPSPP